MRACALILIISALAAGQPTAPIALFRAQSPSAQAFSSVNGGRDWSAIPLFSRTNWSIGFSSVTGGASLIFSRDPAVNATLQVTMYNAVSYTHLTLPTKRIV